MVPLLCSSRSSELVTGFGHACRVEILWDAGELFCLVRRLSCMDLERLVLAMSIFVVVAVGCSSTATSDATSPPTRRIEVIVQDPDGPGPDLTGVTLHVDRIEEYVEAISKVELDTGVNMRVESCDAAAADPSLAELRCFVTERDLSLIHI